MFQNLVFNLPLFGSFINANMMFTQSDLNPTFVADCTWNDPIFIDQRSSTEMISRIKRNYMWLTSKCFSSILTSNLMFLVGKVDAFLNSSINTWTVFDQSISMFLCFISTNDCINLNKLEKNKKYIKHSLKNLHFFKIELRSPEQGEKFFEVKILNNNKASVTIFSIDINSNDRNLWMIFKKKRIFSKELFQRVLS